jgi:hypothetical protein
VPATVFDHDRCWQIVLKNPADVNSLTRSTPVLEAALLRWREARGYCWDNQLCEFPKVLGGGGEKELVLRSGWTAQPQPSQTDDAFKVRK